MSDGDAVEILLQIVGARVEGGLAVLKPGVERAPLVDRVAVVARRRRLRAERVQAEIPGFLVELDVAARVLQIAVDLRRRADAAEIVGEFGRRAAHRLVDAALERRLVVHERRMVPVDAEQAELVEDHRRDPGILVDIEVGKVGGDFGDGGLAASARRVGAGARRHLLAGGDVAVLEVVGVDIVRVEIPPELRLVEEIGVEADQQEQREAKHGLQNPAALGVPAADPQERPQDDADHEADAAADPLENPGEEIHDRIEHPGVPLSFPSASLAKADISRPARTGVRDSPPRPSNMWFSACPQHGRARLPASPHNPRKNLAC